MDKLDKLFKDKLDTRTFEFKEAYWEGAEILIDQDKKDRRRFAFWWWRVGLLMLALGGVTYFVLAKPMDKPEEANSNPTITEITSSSKNDPATKSIENIEATNSLNSKNSTSEISTPEQTQNHNSNSIIPDSQSYENSDVSIQKEKGTTRINREPLQAVPVPDSLNFEIPEVRPDTASKKPKLAFDNQEVLEPVDNSEIANELNSIDILDPLETIAGEIEIPESECADCFDLMTKTFKPKKFSFAVGLEGLYFPKANYPDGLLGGAIGIQSDFRLAKKWALSSGLNYMIADADVFNEEIARYPSGAFDINRNSVESEIYSFGSRTIQTQALPTRMHYIEVPFLVKYKMTNHALSFGIYTDILVGIRGGTETRTSIYPWETVNPSTFDDELTVSNSRKWLDKNEYDKLLFNASIGYDWRVSKSISLNLGSFYNFTGLKNSQEDELISEQYVSGNTFSLDRFHFRAGMKWHFIK